MAWIRSKGAKSAIAVVIAISVLGFGLVTPANAQRSLPQTAAASQAPRDDIVTAFREQYLPLLEVPVRWTGSVSSCRPGRTSTRNQQATLAAVNYFRSLAGLPPVSLDRRYSKLAQAAALIMEANNALTHYPAPSMKCYSKAGYAGASRSNIAISWGYPSALNPTTGARAVAGYMEDPGDGNRSAGHRQWILTQGLTKLGSGDTSRSNALYVGGPIESVSDPKWVTWPPAGYFPRELEPNGRWSIAYPGASFRNARVKVLTPQGPVKARLATAAGYPGLAWDMRLPRAYREEASQDYTVAVAVTGIVVDGRKTSYSWSTTLIRAGSAR